MSDMFEKMWFEYVTRNMPNETGGKPIPCDAGIPNNPTMFYFENNT